MDRSLQPSVIQNFPRLERPSAAGTSFLPHSLHEFRVEMLFALGAMCTAGLSQSTLSSTGLDADMEKLNEYIQADKTNEQSVETLYADLQHRFSVMKVCGPLESTGTQLSARLSPHTASFLC